VIILNCKISIFIYFKTYFIPEISASLLQSSVSRDPSEIIPGFSAQETFLIIMLKLCYIERLFYKKKD